jgi:hypothetical protein
MKHHLILLVAALWLVSCAAPEPEITYTAPELETESWSVKLTVSGGIAGIQRNIQVDETGKYTVTDEQAGNTQTGELTDVELAELESLVTGFEFSSPKTPSMCADCFVYDLEIQSGGKKMLAQADDVNLGDSGMGTLVEFLRGLMDRALQ